MQKASIPRKAPLLNRGLTTFNSETFRPFGNISIETGETTKKRTSSSDSQKPESKSITRFLPGFSLLTSGWSSRAKSTDKGDTQKALKKLEQRAGNLMGYLFYFATQQASGHATQQPIMRLDEALAFAEYFFQVQADIESIADMNTKEYFRNFSRMCLETMDSAQKDALIQSLSKLDFESCIDLALHEFARFIIKENASVLLKGTLVPGKTEDVNDELAEVLAENTERKSKLVAFLKERWVAVSVLQTLREAILTEGRDCDSHLSKIPLPELQDFFLSEFADNESIRLVEQLGKPGRHTSDIAGLLERRAQDIRTRYIFNVTTEEQLIEDPFAKVDAVRKRLASDGIIPEDNSLLTDYAIIKLAFTNYPEQQQDFFSGLSIQALYRFRVAEHLITPTSTSQLQRELNSINRLIDVEIMNRKRASSSKEDREGIEQARRKANKAAQQWVVGNITRELKQAISDFGQTKNSNSLPVDFSATYARLHRQAQVSFAKLVNSGVIPQASLEEGADYAAGLIILGFINGQQSGMNEEEIGIFVDGLSRSQLTSLRSAAPHEEWLKNGKLTQGDWGVMTDRFRFTSF